MSLWRTLENRRAGVLRPRCVEDIVRVERLRRLEVNLDVEIKTQHRGSIAWLDVDRAEERYLLTGGADCTISLFDLDGSDGEKGATTSSDAASSSRAATAATARGARRARHRPREVHHVARTTAVPISARRTAGPASRRHQGHQHSVSVVRWYPIDTGIFISGGFDGYVKVWDTNSLEVALEFDMKEKVYVASMSSAPGQLHLIAVGSYEPLARLCDMRTGAYAQVLKGHSESVRACEWSPRSPYLLATGSADRTVRLWDIRRSGASACLMSLDMTGEEHEGDSSEVGRRAIAEGHNSLSGRGYMKRHELAPHDSRVSKFARAHAGPVNSLCFTPDGLHLLSSGTDNRLRLWDVEHGSNTMKNFLQTKDRRLRPFGMVVAQPAGRRSETVFYPNDARGDVLAFPLHSPDGKPERVLRSHFGPVQCCSYRPRTQELVTCGSDCLVLLWSAGVLQSASRDFYMSRSRRDKRGSGIKRKLVDEMEDHDTWSDDEGPELGGGNDGGLGGASAGTAATGTSSRGEGVASGDGSRRRMHGPGMRAREGFVPPILMQERRGRL